MIDSTDEKSYEYKLKIQLFLSHKQLLYLTYIDFYTTCYMVYEDLPQYLQTTFLNIFI